MIIGRHLFLNNQRIRITSEKEFDFLVEHARANKALARILSVTDTEIPGLRQKVEAAKKSEDVRLEEALNLLDRTQQICLELNVPYTVMKSFDALPDLGHDIDLLVGDNLRRVQDELLSRLQCYPVTLTFCDRQAGKFSTFIQGFAFDFELYARISQLGEEYVSERTVLGNRVLEHIENHNTFMCSLEDRFLITCIHTIYRHGKIRLSDLNIAYEAFKKGVDVDYIIRSVESAGIQKGFTIFITILETGERKFTGQVTVPRQIQEYAVKVLRSDRLLSWSVRRLRQAYPLKLPIMLSVLLFLYKAPMDITRGRAQSSLRSILATGILLIDKAIPLRLQKAIGVRIW